jgi:hypothetical protein
MNETVEIVPIHKITKILAIPGLQALRFRVLFFDVVEIKDFKLMFF